MLTHIHRHALILMLMAWVVGCASVWEESGPNHRLTEMDEPEPPVNSYYHFSQAHFKAMQSDFDGAIAGLQDALSLDPESLYLKKELAGLWVMNKQNAKALETLDEILAVHPDDVEALILSGRIHQRMNQTERAMAAYAKALPLDPLNEDLYLQLGRMYIEQQQWDKAKSVYEKLVVQFPGSFG